MKQNGDSEEEYEEEEGVIEYIYHESRTGSTWRQERTKGKITEEQTNKIYKNARGR